MTFALMLDIVITFLLAGTIYFVWKLSEQMARFRNSRADMERVIRDLNIAVDRAQQSIIAMRGSADTSGQELQKIMRSATELSDELQIMTESANALATRLERAAGSQAGTVANEPMRPVSSPSREEHVFSGFAIRDPEFDGTVEPDHTGADWNGSDDDGRSQAEKDLARAMQQNKKPTRSVM